MRETDFSQFSALLDGVLGLYPRSAPVSTVQRAMFFRAVAAHSLDQVQAAFDAHVKDPQRGRFAPLPADVIAQIEGAAHDDRRPGPEEAWAIALAAADEGATVVWTDETAQAWGIARPVLKAGDKVGARMAFREAYERIVAEARIVRRPVGWYPSLGQDAAGRDAAIREGIERGWLREADYPRLEAPAATLAHLLEAPKGYQSEAAKAAREKLAQQREELLRFSRAPGDAADYVAPPPVCFTPIPAEFLPPGMRPRPDAEAEYAAAGGAL